MADQLQRICPRIHTKRLFLRPPGAADAERIASIVGDWNVARYLARVPYPYGLADARYFLDHVAPGEWVWAITLGDKDKLIGVIGLTSEENGPSAELGYWLSPAHWGQGIATEAARAIVSYGFETLGLPYILSGYFEENPASGRVLEKIGFTETGRFPRPCLADNSEKICAEMRLYP